MLVAAGGLFLRRSVARAVVATFAAGRLTLVGRKWAAVEDPRGGIAVRAPAPATPAATSTGAEALVAPSSAFSSGTGNNIPKPSRKVRRAR
jgi:hypothetical protein